MKTMKFLLSLCLVICASLISLTSCSNNDDETGFKFNYSDRAYLHFQEEGLKRMDFSKLTPNQLDLVINSTWNRRCMINADNDTTLCKNEQIEITKDGTYAVTKENVKRSFRIKNMKWADKSLLLTLDNGSVIQYDSIIWSTNDCSLVSTGKDGTRYVDDRTVWEGTADLLYWCNSWIYY